MTTIKKPKVKTKSTEATPIAENHTETTAPDVERLALKQIPSKDLKALKMAVKEDLQYISSVDYGAPQMGKIPLNPDNSIDKQAFEIERLQKHIDWLEERHCQDAEHFYKMEAELKESENQRYKEMTRGDLWRVRFRDMETENERLKAEITKQDELLQKAANNERLLFMTMDKARELYGRLLEDES